MENFNKENENFSNDNGFEKVDHYDQLSAGENVVTSSDSNQSGVFETHAQPNAGNFDELCKQPHADNSDELYAAPTAGVQSIHSDISEVEKQDECTQSHLLDFDSESTDRVAEACIAPSLLVSGAMPELSGVFSSVIPDNQTQVSNSALSGVMEKMMSDERSSLVIKSEVKTSSETKGIAGCLFGSIDPRVLDLIYWRDVKKTGAVFAILFVLLLSLMLFSVISVLAYLSLAILVPSTGFVFYKKVIGIVQKSNDGHPFKSWLEYDITPSTANVYHIADVSFGHMSHLARDLSRIFLVEDIVASLKFALFLWALTYIGACFNGLTILMIFVIGLFTVPKFYETYEDKIDHYADVVRTKAKTTFQKIKEKVRLPQSKKKEE